MYIIIIIVCFYFSTALLIAGQNHSHILKKYMSNGDMILELRNLEKIGENDS